MRVTQILKVLPLVVVTLWWGGTAAPASVEDAKSFSMEAAAPHLKDGFSMRSESWSGSLKPGKRKAIRHQLFRGNEYWFWLGLAEASTRVSLKVYDSRGRPVHVETVQGEYWVAVRVLAPKTGTYLVVISSPDDGVESNWSLAYGYR